nr:hypothetical protein [Tanacetum cinerariifolium]
MDKATSSQAWLWHRRLSHLNFDTINLLSNNDIVEKGDECIFVGYSTQLRAYRVYNKRTRVIMESIHVNFDELPQMASAHNSSDPAPTCQKLASVQISSDPSPACQTMALEHGSLSPGHDIQCAGSDHDHYQEAACTNYEDHMMHDSDNEVPVVHSDVSSVPTTAFMMIYDDICEPHDQSVSYPSQNTAVQISVTAELATYKEHVELYEQRTKFELTEREQKINEQLIRVISDRNFREETLKGELHSIKLQLTSTINHNKLIVEEVSFLKRDFKQKENKFFEDFLDMKSLKEKVEDKLIKQDQSLQTVHMLCRSRPNPNELNRVAIGYKNPLCLTHAKQVQPALYNGHEIIKDNHKPTIVYDTEDTLEIAEITRKKMNNRINDPECVTRKVKIAPPDYSKENFLATFTPQKQLTPEQIFWSNDLMKLKFEALKEQTKVSRPIKAFTVYPPNTPATLVPKVLPIKKVFCVAPNSELNVAQFTEMCVANTTAEARCLALEAELANLRDTNNHDNQKELINHFSKLKTTDSHITKLTDQVTHLQAQNDLFRAENDKIKQHYKDLYDSIKITHVEPIIPRLRNNRDVHLDYLRHLKERVETIHDIVEEAKVVRPRDRSIVSACRYTKHSHELLEYPIGTCPQGSQKQAKQLAHIPLIRKKQVSISKPSDKSDGTTHPHVVTVKSQKTHVPVPPSTGVNSYPNASGSQPKSHVKSNRISPAKDVNKLPVEDQPRTNKSHLRTSNRVASSSHIKRTIINLNSDSMCQTCNKCLTSSNHDMCVATCLQSVMATPFIHHNCSVEQKVKQVWKPKQVRQVWKPTGKVLTTIGHQRRPTCRIFNLGNQCPLTRGKLVTKKMAIPNNRVVANQTDLVSNKFVTQSMTTALSIEIESLIEGESNFEIYDTNQASQNRKQSNKMADLNAPSGQTPAMAPPLRVDDQILPHIKWVPIGKSKCYLDLEKSQSNPIYKIAMDLLKNTNFFRAFTASSTIPLVYIQQFWDTILYDKKARCYMCQLDEQWFVLTKETLREALHITPVNNDQAFAAPPSIDGLIDFVNQLGYPKLVRNLSNRRDRFHLRPDSPLHLANEEPILRYLKFSTNGTKREVFEMPIPGSLITVEIQQASYYREYLAKVAQHGRYLAGETGGIQDPPAPKATQPAKKPKTTAPKAHSRPSVSIPVRSAQPAPTSSLANPQENKRKQAAETSDKPPKEKKSKHGWVSKKRSRKNVEASKTEEVPTVEPQVADEDAEYQKVLEESIKDAYALPRGTLPPVVIREPESGKYQPLPEVPGKGKAKVTEEQVTHDLLSLQKYKKTSPADQYIFQRRVSEPTRSFGHDESPYALLGQSNSQEELEKVVLGAKEGGQDEGQARPDPDAQAEEQTGLDVGAQAEDQTGSDAGAQAEGHAGSNPDETSEGQAGSNPNETSEGQAGPDPGDAEAKQLDEGFTVTAYPKVQENLKLSIEEQVLLEESASSSGTQSSLQHLSRDFCFRDQFFSDKPSKVDKNEETEVESMVNVPIQQAMSIISLQTSPIIDLSSRPESPKAHQQFKATTTDTKTTTLPPP